MRISVSADTKDGIALRIEPILRKMGHTVLLHGALFLDENPAWPVCSSKTALDVAEGLVDFGIVCCHTGIGSTMAANKVPLVRAAFCIDAYSASAARRCNDANVMGISLRLTTEQVFREMIEAWFISTVDKREAKNIAYINNMV